MTTMMRKSMMMKLIIKLISTLKRHNKTNPRNSTLSKHSSSSIAMNNINTRRIRLKERLPKTLTLVVSTGKELYISSYRKVARNLCKPSILIMKKKGDLDMILMSKLA